MTANAANRPHPSRACAPEKRVPAHRATLSLSTLIPL
jgi:hypothetical protein